MKNLLILMTVVSSLTLTACASEKGVLNELTNDAYQGVNEFEQVMLNLNENPEIVNDFIPSNVAKESNYSDEFKEAMERYDKVVEEKPEEDLEDKLFHPTDTEVYVPHTKWKGQTFEEIVNDIIDEIIVRAPHGKEPNTYYIISNEGPFGGAKFEMERCYDGMLHVTCYGNQDCYSNLIDARIQIKTALERSGEMLVRVDVEYGEPDRYVPGSNDIKPRF